MQDTDPPPSSPEKPTGQTNTQLAAEKRAREERVAAALRVNLMRRKQQARARAAAPKQPADPEKPEG
jgi:hypothetical protein